MNIRDLILKQRQKDDKKKDEKPRYRSVLCAANGSWDTGSVWANENQKLVYFQFFGSGGVGVARCEKITPQLGLGVYVGQTDDKLAWQVLEDDPLLRRTATDSRNYQTISPGDFEPGGRLQLWLYTKLIVPLATYDTPGTLWVNVTPGDYPYLGTRKTFVGVTNLNLSASIPGTVGQSRYVGLYLDSANTIQTIDGTAGALPVEPSWPAGAFRLSVVRLTNGQTSISFADDIFDRRMPWGEAETIIHNLLSATHPDTLADSVQSGDIIIGNATPKWARLGKGTDSQVLTLASGLPSWADPAGGGWPFAHVLTVSPDDTDAGYSTIEAAITAASAGDTILIEGSYSPADTITVNKAVTITCLDPYGATISFSVNSKPAIKLTTANAKVVNLNIIQAGAGTTASALEIAANGCAIENTICTANGAANNGFGIFISAGTGIELRNCQAYDANGTVISAGLYVSSGCEAAAYGGIYDGDDADIQVVSGGTAALHNLPTLTNGLLSNAGTMTGSYDYGGNIYQLSTNDIFPQSSANGLNARFERLFGDDKPTIATDWQVDTFRNADSTDTLGFVTNTTASSDSYTPSSNFQKSNTGTVYFYVKNSYLYANSLAGTAKLIWTSATGKRYLKSILQWMTRIGVPYGGEVRMYGVALASIIGSSPYVAVRFVYDVTTYPSWPWRIRIHHGTGTTYAIADGGAADSDGPFDPFNSVKVEIDVGLRSPYGCAVTVRGILSQLSVNIVDVTYSSGEIDFSTFKTAVVYLATSYQQFALQDIEIA